MPMDLAGKRCVGFARAHGEDAGNQLDRQIKSLMDFAQKQGMIWVGEVRLTGHAGDREVRKALDDLVNRQDRERFCDVLACENWSRVSRHGAHHGFRFKMELESHGIFAISTAASDDAFGWVIEGMEFQAAVARSRTLSEIIQRSRKCGILNGATPFVAQTPLAIDRLYVDAQGKPLHVCRTTAIGSQMLSPVTKEVLRDFPASHGYRKRTDERIIFVPGANEDVSAVQNIFGRRFMDGWTARKIAEHLNNEKSLGPKGKLWTGFQVQRIIQNPLYIGVGIAFKTSTAGPSWRVEETCRRLIRRPTCEWLFIDHPQLRNVFVDEGLAEKVKRYQFARLGLKVDCQTGPAA